MAPGLKSRKSSVKKEDVTWILEGIVGFLQSPSWSVPIMNFIDDNCACFENKEENKFEYTDIHIKYKKLVEELLFLYIRELNISEDAFAHACEQQKGNLKRIEGMFEYIWAADDFLLFKRLMSQHNLELEMQVIQLSQTQRALEATHSNGDSPPYNPLYKPYASYGGKDASGGEAQSTMSEKPDNLKNVLSESKHDYSEWWRREIKMHEREEEDVKRAIEFSRMEMERLNAQAEEERRMLEEAIRLSLQISSPAQQQDATCTTLPQTDPIKQLSPSNSKITIVPVPAVEAVIDEARAAKNNKPKSVSKQHHQQTELPPLRQKSNAEAATDWIQSAQKEVPSTSQVAFQPHSNKGNSALLLSKPSGIDPAELAQRKEYLKGQREKLLELKKKQRQTDLERYKDGVAESGPSKQVEQSAPVTSSSTEEGLLKARRALADRLRKEVTNKNH